MAFPGVCRVSVNKGRNHSRVGTFPGDGEPNPDNGEEDDDGDPGAGDLG
jgi:hypothetical protein